MTAPAIIPVDAQPMRTLTLAMAVMCYLATLALGALMLVEAAVTQWTSGSASEVTVQLRPSSGTDLSAETDKALRDSPRSARRVGGAPDRQGRCVETAGTLARQTPPWKSCRCPSLIAVAIDRARPPDLAALEQRCSRR